MPLTLRNWIEPQAERAGSSQKFRALSVVDVSSAEGDAVKRRSLRQCNSCEAAIALKLGADESFVGVVTRISRVEYSVRFQICDARTGPSFSPSKAIFAWARIIPGIAVRPR